MATTVIKERNIWHIFWILIVTSLATGDDETKIYDDDSTVLLDSYVPAAMQLLSYHLELLKYETLASTTIEPPFYGDGVIDVSTNRVVTTPTTTIAPTTTTRRSTTTTTTHKPWWLQISTEGGEIITPSTTQRPWWVQTFNKTQTPSTTTQKPWWTTTKKRISTTTQKPWWTQTTTQKRISTTTQKPWWTQSTTKKRLSTTTQKPWTQSTTKKVWWVPTTTKKVIWWSPPSTTPRPQRTTSTKPTTWWWPTTFTTPNHQRTTTRRPTNWSWGAETSTQKVPTTPRHAPAIFAPMDSFLENANNLLNAPKNTFLERANNFLSGPSFLQWFYKPKAVSLKSDIAYDFKILDPLPASLVKDVDNDLSELSAISDEDNVKVFLSKYDDSVRYQLSSAGKKRVPPAKPYVEFLILYDVLKRDTKAAKLENFQGYTPKMEHELHELSSRSSEIQLYYILKRSLEGNSNKVLKDDAVIRIKNILKDLENPNSATVKILRYIPPLNFIL